ncbi:MAG: DNA primase [Bacteroidales bacterium]|nr:DNA primase [Bacteroidales bacterium]
MINQETIQRIMDATRIEEVIGDFVSLKKRGANHIGCCPFHNEKTPSFYVSPSKGIFKCFGCGKAGNAVGFLMDHEHYTYPEALRWLAQKYNIEIEEEKMSDEQRERQSVRDALFHVSEFAQKYFAELMWEDEMGRAVGLSYFHERGLTDKVIKDFGLGYCLDKWTDFTDHARKNGYSDEVLEKTGLTIFKEDGKVFDRFKGRVMFPIYSISGRVLGFSGRVMSKEKQVAKYVNSPDSEIYNKSNILYGLFQAKNAISRADKCYLVEGNVDVVSMHQSDVCNTVASCGTSLTVEQIRLIKRYTQNITVVYDGDSAGIKAALRAFNLLFEEGMHAHAVLFPDEEDPDSYAQKYGSTQLQEYLREHEMNFVEFKMATSGIPDIGAIDPIRKSNLIKEYTDSLALIQDPNEQSGYITLIASALRVNENDLRRTLAQTIAAHKRQAGKEEQRELAREEAAAEQAIAEQAMVEQTTGEYPETAPLPDGYTTPPQVLADLRPAEAQERRIASLLVKNGSRMVKMQLVDQEGKEFTQEVRVADIVTAELTADNLGFDNPTYKEIFDLYTHAVGDGRPLPDANYFAQHPDTVLRNTALEMMMSTYGLSPQWEEKKTIAVPNPDDNLNVELEETILAYKKKKLEQRMADKQYELRQCKDPDEQMIIMAQYNELKQLQQQAGQSLHQVVS